MFIKKIILKLIKFFFSIFNYEIELTKNKYSHTGIYHSYKDAFLASNNPYHYKDENNLKQKNLIDLKNLEDTQRSIIFPLFYLNNFNDLEKEKEILEIGAGNNPLFLYFLKNTNKKLKFNILEVENFKVKIPSEFKNYIKYYDKIENINLKNISSVIFSSSIQFIENYLDILDKIFINKIKYVIITDTFFTERDKNIYVLSCMGNIKFPNTFLSYKELNNIFQKNSYKQIFITKRNISQYSHDKLNTKEFFLRDIIYKLI